MIPFQTSNGTVWVKPEYIVCIQIAQYQASIHLANGIQYEVTPQDAERVLLALTSSEKEVQS